MTIAVYHKADLKRFSATFKNSAGTATDPTTVTFTYTKPSGTQEVDPGELEVFGGA